MARFKYTDNSQGQFIQINLQEQLLLGSFEWIIDYLIGMYYHISTKLCSRIGEPEQNNTGQRKVYVLFVH